jgi:hypothetical protein
MQLKTEIIDYKIRFYKKNPYLIGSIKINTFYEEFYMQIGWWSANDYEQQWREGLERIKICESSCLITNIQDPQYGNFIEWWLMYRIDKNIYIYNQWLFREAYDELVGIHEFTVDSCYNFVGNRKNFQYEDGTKLSEWVVNLDD